MSLTETLQVDLVEKEIINVDIIDKELIKIELSVIDVLPIRRNIGDLDNVKDINSQDGQVLVKEGDYWVNKDFQETELNKLIYNEVPTKINSKRFQTLNSFVTGKLEVFLNGIKEKEIIIINSTIFELKIDTITEDVIEVNYVKQ